MKKIISAFLNSILLFTLLLLSSCTPSPRLSPLSPDAKVLAFGDSITYGTGVAESESYPYVLQGTISRTVINAGIPGETTAEGLRRLPSAIDEHRPALMILCLGGNDFLQKVPLEVTFANLDTIVTRIQSKRAAVLLLGSQSGLFGDKAAAPYLELARRRHTGYVANILEGILTRADLKADAIHPNDRGYEAMADRIEPELRWMLRKMRRLR